MRAHHILILALAGVSACSILDGVIDKDTDTPPVDDETTDVVLDLDDFLTEDDEDDSSDAVVGLVPPPDIATESSWCWTVGADEGQLALYVVGLDSGTVRRAGRYGEVSSSLSVDGLAYDGVDRLVFVTSGSGELVELDLTAQVLTVGPRYSAGSAAAVSTWGDEFLLVDPSQSAALLYADFQAMLDGTPSGETPPLQGLISRHTVDGDTLYGAWHSTDVVDVVDLTTGTLIEQIHPDGYDGWVRGMGVAGGLLHLLDTDDVVHRFDLDGAAVSTASVDVGLGRGVGGLWCDAP